MAIRHNENNDGIQWLEPDWPAPGQVRACSSLRTGGVSEGLYQSLNLGDHVGDHPDHVAENRTRLHQALALPAAPVWLQQVHGITVVNAAGAHTGRTADARPAADASWTGQPAVVCAVLTADCLPVLLCQRNGARVAAVHAGWRGLASGVIEAACQVMDCPGDELLAWLGPAIGPQVFEVGGEVREPFLSHDAEAACAFQATRAGHWNADLYRLARQRLASCGVSAVYGGGLCTLSDPERFFSYRRDGNRDGWRDGGADIDTGRMATLIWLG